MKRRPGTVGSRRLTNGTRTEDPDLSRVVKVSHTLTADVAERLREFAFFQRFSESAVIEYALVRLFASADDSSLGTALRRSGAGRRRKA